MCIKRFSEQKIREYLQQDQTLRDIIIPTEGVGSPRQLKKLGIGIFKALCLSAAVYGMRFETSKDTFFHTLPTATVIRNFMLAVLSDNAVDAIFEKLAGYDLAPTVHTSVKLVNSRQLAFRHVTKLGLGIAVISFGGSCSAGDCLPWYPASRSIDVLLLTIGLFSPYKPATAIVHNWEKELR